MVEMEYMPQTESSKIKFDSVKTFVYTGLISNQLDIKTAAEVFKCANNEDVVKAAFDHTFRVFVIENMGHMSTVDIKKTLDLAVKAVQKKLCVVTTPIFIINDLLSSLTIDKCLEVFCYLEDNSHIWKSEAFYSSVKNHLLRMCNDLLKRLSKSQNTVFSGRIHLFLAKLFPLNEKSGLNLMSHFSDNFTRYTTTPDAFEKAINKHQTEPMDTELDSSQVQAEQKVLTHFMPIDYKLYIHFWSLQEFFNKPNICFDKMEWKKFTSNSNEILDALKSYRLEDTKNNQAKSDEYDDMSSYFAKYLTSEKLLDLQLNDFNFRRQILIQFLILFQYLSAEVKFKSATHTLNDEQVTWCRSAIRKCHDLLKDTPPGGPHFDQGTRHILEREEIWNKWKNDGCPNYVKEKSANKPTASKRQKPTTSDFLADSGSTKKFAFDYSDITRLCNIDHANLEACKEPARLFLPTLRDFFDEAIEQMDPSAQVERQYYLTNQTDWAWKALRLLAKRSSYYFMQNQNVKTISEYLEAICNKLSKEFASELQKEQQMQKELLQKEEEQARHNEPENEEDEDLGNEFDEEQGHHKSALAAAGANDDLQDTQETMNTSARNDYEASCSPGNVSPAGREKLADYEIANSPVVATEKKTLLDEELINVVVESVESGLEWQKIAICLGMDEDTISFIENEGTDVKEQCRKILQLWREREEKRALPKIVLEALRGVERKALAERFEAKLNEWSL